MVVLSQWLITTAVMRALDVSPEQYEQNHSDKVTD
jgi:hypothetical protein